MSGRGKAWEAMLLTTFESIAYCGIRKVDPPTRFTRGRMRYGTGGKGDFEGKYRGVRFVIEAKDADGREGFDRHHGISDRQIARLDAAVEAGDVAALALRLRDEEHPENDLMWLVGWRMFESFPWTRVRVKTSHARFAICYGLGTKLMYSAGIVRGVEEWMAIHASAKAMVV